MACEPKSNLSGHLVLPVWRVTHCHVPPPASSCGAFLKTWLPFLMLAGIVLTVALALNLR